MYQYDRHHYQKERFIQSFEKEQKSKIEYNQKLEEERKIREQQDKEFQDALMKDQLREIEKIQQQELIPEPVKPLTQDELRIARLAYFSRNLESVAH
jgi:hypothetical protein